jgi:hypothetical protein
MRIVDCLVDMGKVEARWMNGLSIGSLLTHVDF